MTFLEQCITPEPVQRRLSPECESIIAEIVADHPLAFFAGVAKLCLAMFGLIYLFAAWGAAQ